MKRFSVYVVLASLFATLAVTLSLRAASASAVSASAPMAPVEIQLEAWVGPSLLWVCTFGSGSDCGSHSIQRGLTQNLRYRVGGTDRNIVCTSTPMNFLPWPNGSWEYTANEPDVLWTVDCAGDVFGATKFVHLTSPDPNPPPPPPPPPPPEWQWTLLDSNPPDYQGSGSDECMDVKVPCSLLDPTVVRCKVYVFVLKPHEGHFGIDFGPAFKYEGRWRICYRPYGGGITEVSYRIGDATDTYNLWEWRGNDSGYPSHIREAHHVYVRYGGGAAICIGGQWGCGPERHFRLTHTFKDTGLYGSITTVENYL